MKIFPAIDLRGGKAVRLTKGDFDKMKVYSDEPYVVAKKFIQDGTTCIHTVDLDGALEGRPVNKSVIARIASLGLELQVGGGIRTRSVIEDYLEVGVTRVILGTIAIENPNFVGECVMAYGDAVAVGVDAIDGMVAIHGWKEITDKNAYDFCLSLRDLGVQTVIFTDISKDGMLSGMNIEAYAKLSRIDGLNIIASGGLSSTEDIRRLKEIGVYGGILGKAMYEGALTLLDALSLATGV